VACWNAVIVGALSFSKEKSKSVISINTVVNNLYFIGIQIMNFKYAKKRLLFEVASHAMI
jgi:hypothetical protein